MTNSRIAFEVNAASEAQIARHLGLCDADFVPPLGKRVDLDAYARKIVGSATRFEAWDGVLVGLLAVYCNDPGGGIAFVTSVSVLPEWRGKGIASHLIDLLIAHARRSGFRRVELEVDRDNAPAQRRYEKAGFVVIGDRGGTATMCLNIEDPK